MKDNLRLAVFDFIINPQPGYRYPDQKLEGYRVIAPKEAQGEAGSLQPPAGSPGGTRQFGQSPIKPYRDYYGTFQLETRLLSEALEVKFAIGYALDTKVITVDDYSNFSWLRLCTGIDRILYPNLAHQKQLLDYLLARSPKPRFLITRVYQYLQFELYQFLAAEILKRDSSQVK